MPFLASRRCCIAVAIAISLGMGSLPAMAQSSATRHEIKLPEQSLADSLRALGQTAHVNIVFEPDAVLGKRAPVLDGRYTPAEALAQLLAGSGLAARPTAGGSYAVEAPDASAASSVPNPERNQESDPVAAQAPSSQVRDGAYTFDPLLVIGKVEGFSATRLPTALKDVPQSVSIITRDTLQEQNAHTLDEALNWSTGITLSRTSSVKNNLISRGFGVGTIHIDGGAPLALTEGNTAGLDLTQYERIEVLRGSDALFGGRGEPSASINLTRKRPLAESAASVVIKAGAWDNYRMEVDLSDPISADGRLRGRLVAARDDQGYFYDTAQRKMTKLYAVMDYDLTAATRLTLGGSREDSRRIPVQSGVPRYLDGRDAHLPRSTGLTFPWAKVKANISEVFAQMEQGLGERWRLKLGVTRTNNEDEGLYPEMRSGINPVTGLMTSLPRATYQRLGMQQTSADLNLTGAFDWNGRTQEIVLGADWARSELSPWETRGMEIQGPAVDPYRFDPDLYPQPVPGPYDSISSVTMDSRQYGIYAAAKLRPADRWAITVGARNNFSRVLGNTYIRAVLPMPAPLPPFVIDYRAATQTSDTGILTPYAAAVYELNERYSLYASYTEVYQANVGNFYSNGKPLDPKTGVNMETGLKGAWHGGRLNGSFVLYKVELQGVPEHDPNTPPGNGSLCCSIPVTQHSKGAEMELSGLVMPGWQISAGYTFNINRKFDGATLQTGAPKHLLRLWTNYQLPGAASAWSVGGGVNAQTAKYSQDTVCPAFGPAGNCIAPSVRYRAVQGFFAVTTLRVGYRVSDRWDLALNVDNLFDRRYYPTIGGPNGGSWYGTPRNWMLSLRGQF